MSGIYVSGQWESVYLFMPMCICVQDPADCKWKYLVQDSEPGVLRATSLPSSQSTGGEAAVPWCSRTLGRGKGKALTGSLSHSDLRSGGSWGRVGSCAVPLPHQSPLSHPWISHAGETAQRQRAGHCSTVTLSPT